MNNIHFMGESSLSRWEDHHIVDDVNKPTLNYSAAFPLIKQLIREDLKSESMGEHVLLAAIDKIAGEIFVVFKQPEHQTRTAKLYKWSCQTNLWNEEFISKSETIGSNYKRCLNYANLTLCCLENGYTAKLGLDEYDPESYFYNKNYFKMEFINGSRSKVFSFSAEDPHHTNGCFLISAVDLRQFLCPIIKNARNAHNIKNAA